MYEGPLFIDVRLPAEWRIADERPGEPVTPEQVASGDVGRMRAAAAMGAEPAPSGRAPLLTVSNHHGETCGEPPAVDGDAAETHVGYFENEYGEQAIYTYDAATGAATIRMGDGAGTPPSASRTGSRRDSCSGRPRRSGCTRAGLPRALRGAVPRRVAVAGGGGTGQGAGSEHVLRVGRAWTR